ncbi:MAG: response regulator [Bacteriovoracaceae bacterium]
MKNVLIVDDSVEILELIQLYLETSLNIKNIFKATSGSEAIEYLKTHQFSLIISDYQMPDGDGPSLYRYLKSNKIDTPFIFVGGDLPDHRDEELYLLHKPFGREELLKTIKAAMEDNSLNRPIA